MRFARAIAALAMVLGWTRTAGAQQMAGSAPLMVARTNAGQVLPLPLIEESARVDIDQQHATTVMRHVYHNQNGARVEGHFSFRTGDGTNVGGFAYWNGEQKIVGEVMETGAARQVYNSTVQRRRDPGLLEKTGEGSFAFKVFPIEPGERKRIEITLEQWLTRRDRAVEYRLPIARPGAEVEVALHDDRRIRRLTSSTHAIDVTGAGTSQVRVRVGAPRSGEPRELSLRWELEDAGWKLDAHAHRDPGQLGYVELALAAPPLDVELNQDLTLVIDASPTMAGEPLHQARVAAGHVIHRLHGADRLNVIVVGAETRSLFPTPRWATKDAREAAINYVLALREGRGGDLARGLGEALAAQDTTPRPRTILLLTDGRSGARRALEIAANDRGPARVFTVGFGREVDRPALSRLASLKRGGFTLVESAEALPGRIDRLSQQIATPVLTHLALEAQGGALREVYPRTLPDLYQGQELRVLGRFDGSGPVKLTLRAQAQGGKPVALTAAIDASRSPRRPWIGKLWARERVGDLLEEMALGITNDRRREETIELALAYNIVTPFTSFLAIPASEVLTAEAAQTLAEARRRKQAILSQSPDAVALGGPSASADQGGYAPSPPMGMPGMAMPESAGVRPSMAPDSPSPVSEARVHARGCAGCHVGEGQTEPRGLLLAALGVALIALRRRSRG
jgi:Ca-activated chloride channel family protein